LNNDHPPFHGCRSTPFKLFHEEELTATIYENPEGELALTLSCFSTVPGPVWTPKELSGSGSYSGEA